MTEGTAAYYAEITLAMLRARRRRSPEEVRMEYLPEEQCRAVSPPPDEDYCTLRYGHPGPCSWRKK